ncbi:Golgi membrane protein 1-like isoform X3 [Mya arenaria]|uniref:Golgi membrane protein 1-like isoform X3 n=1 Tax=Mya arenaria TaxID=6604 RepID=UPI0022E5C742|nr:Golgi membrane protein 1-like isoform X3 [Mya arenaria]
MAANGRGNMRPAGRSPPFLAIGLTVALVILGFNYWSLSARNGEQASEIMLMESELRLVNAKKVSAEKRSDAIQDKVKDFEEDIRKYKEANAKCQTDSANFKSRVEDLEKQVTDVQNELKTAEELRTKCTDELAEKNVEVDTVKNAAKNCSESECESYVRMGRSQERRDTLQDVYQVAGPQPLISMLDQGRDVSSLTAEIQTLKQQQAENAYKAPQGVQGVEGAGQFNQQGYNAGAQQGQEGGNQNPANYNAAGINPAVPDAGNNQPIVRGNQQPVINDNQDGQQGVIAAEKAQQTENLDQSGKADSNARPGEEIPVLPVPNDHNKDEKDGQPDDLGHQDDGGNRSTTTASIRNHLGQRSENFTSMEGQAAGHVGITEQPERKVNFDKQANDYNDAEDQDADDDKELHNNLKFQGNAQEDDDVQRDDDAVDKMAMKTN